MADPRFRQLLDEIAVENGLEIVARVVWPKWYFAASVGCVSEQTVRRYIEQRWDAA